MSPLRKFTLALFFTLLAVSLPAIAWQEPGSAPDQNQAATSDRNVPTFRTEVVSRTLKSVDYRHGVSTKVNLQINAEMEHLRAPNSYGLEYLTYVLWAITPEGRARNLGEMVVKEGKSSLQVTTELQAFGLIVTAEPYFAVTQPSDMVVAQNIVRSDTKGREEGISVRYELLPRGVYTAQVKPIGGAVYGVDRRAPLDLLEARNAVRIAQDSHADQYAESSLARAEQLLKQAEDYYRRRQGSKPIATVAREATQTAEEARVMALNRDAGCPVLDGKCDLEAGSTGTPGQSRGHRAFVSRHSPGN